MNWQAKWIWLDASQSKDGSEINVRALARKVFEVKSVDVAELAITADSRYRVMVNGTWINDGPTRSFPWAYSYDVLDIAPYLHAGRNVVAVEVLHVGTGTFHMLATRAGLLAQIILRTGNKTQVIGSDRTWKMTVDRAYAQKTGRVSCQLPHEEQIDARQSAIAWETADFDDRKWRDAAEICKATEGPWKNLSQRQAPVLTRRVMQAERCASSAFVRPPTTISNVNLFRIVFPERRDSNGRQYFSVVATNLISPAAQTIALYRTPSAIDVQHVVNGKALFHPDWCKPALVKLQKGPNLLLSAVQNSHYDEHQVVIDAPKPLEFRNPFGSGQWGVAGPLDPNDPIWARLPKINAASDLAEWSDRFVSAPDEFVFSSDVHAATTHRQILPGTPIVQAPGAMFADNAEITTIKPGKHDIELVIDFGKELNAFIQLDLCADAGVVIDGNVFESYVNGRPQWAWMNRSAFRYITRDGWQKHTTVRHFGGRYLTLTIRNLKSELKIRHLAPIFTHHQAEDRGSFRSNDYLVNQTWQVGKHTLLCCMEDTFTDCPTYEQTCWIGDARNEALICQSAFGEPGVIRRGCELGAQSVHRSDLVESQCPSGWENLLPAWSFMWVMMSWEYYWFTGDDAIVRKSLYPATAKMFSNIQKKYIDKRGLISIAAWNLFDWTNIDAPHPCVTHNSMFLVAAYRAAAKMAKAIGRTADAKRWTRDADKLVVAINKHLWCDKRGAYVDGMDPEGKLSSTISRPTNTLALLYDIAPAPRAKKIEPIVFATRTKDVIPFGSPFAMFYLLEYYAKVGRFDCIDASMRDKWKMMLDWGATSFWETFPQEWKSSLEPMEGANVPMYPTRSHCHAWSAGPTYFLSRYALGVEATKPAFAEIRIAPVLMGLKDVEGVVPTSDQDISVHWRRCDNGRFVYRLDIPKPVKATFVVPSELKAKSVTINGRAASIKKGGEVALPKMSSIEIVVITK